MTTHVTRRWSILALAMLIWLALTRLPLDGGVLFAVTIAWGTVFGALIRHWLAGPALLIAAIVGDYLALALGWFHFLGDFWFIPPLAGALAGLLSGVVSERTAPRAGRESAAAGQVHQRV